MSDALAFIAIYAMLWVIVLQLWVLTDILRGKP